MQHGDAQQREELTVAAINGEGNRGGGNVYSRKSGTWASDT